MSRHHQINTHTRTTCQWGYQELLWKSVVGKEYHYKTNNIVITHQYQYRQYHHRFPSSSLSSSSTVITKWHLMSSHNGGMGFGGHNIHGTRVSLTHQNNNTGISPPTRRSTHTNHHNTAPNPPNTRHQSITNNRIIIITRRSFFSSSHTQAFGSMPWWLGKCVLIILLLEGQIGEEGWLISWLLRHYSLGLTYIHILH